jgi:hypothetical protein
MRKRRYNINLNTFVTEDMKAAVINRAEELGYPSESALIRRILMEGLPTAPPYVENGS